MVWYISKMSTNIDTIKKKIDSMRKDILRLSEELNTTRKELVGKIEATNEKMDTNHKELINTIWQNNVETSNLRERMTAVETRNMASRVIRGDQTGRRKCMLRMHRVTYDPSLYE
jgi:predicted  nucleic acid-binding Zn-ribbon protein